jgi:amino acid adenylation domain-containing protein
MGIVIDPHPISDRTNDLNVDYARQYWMRVLSTEYGDPIIPIDRSRKANGLVKGPLPLTISGVTFERLYRLTGKSSFLIYVTLLAAVKISLYKYSRNSVITVGAPLRGKSNGSPEPSNVLAIVDRLDGAMSFRTLLQNIKDTVIDAYQYQDYPLQDIVNYAEDEERQFRPQVLLVVEDFHSSNSSLSSDIMLRFEVGAAEVRGIVDFDHSLFCPDLIQRFTSDLQNVLDLALEDTTTSVNDLSALTPAEHRQLLLDWNNTDRLFPRDHCLHELFVSQVHATPEAVAVIYEDQHLSYMELNRRANQLAHHLMFMGVRPEERVALCMDRSLEMVVGVLGVLKAGGAYVPLDPGYPPGRLSYMLNDAQAAILLTQQHLLERLPLAATRTVCLDQGWERIGEEDESEPWSGCMAENLAYIIYTSGSTGRPKGVMVTHRGVCNLVEAQKEAFRVSNQSRVLQFASLSFDASVSEIFSTLTAGGSLRVCAKESLMAVADLTRVFTEDQITIVTLPPTLLALLEPVESPKLQTVIAAGEACTAEVVERWARGIRLLDAYGPTEATVCASIGECEAGSHRNPAIGRPIANTRLYIIDGKLKPVPVGVQGELYISGVGLARGYCGRPDFTAERYIPHLFSQEEGARLYRTGDECRYLPNGALEFIGRRDEQVKVRGYRIELGEIEAVLNEHASVRQSVVVASEDERGGKRLLGFVVGESVATSAELKNYVRERLPEYMIPETILRLATMPLTANGKIDRKRLPMAPLLIDPEGEGDPEEVGARTPVEEIVVGIFERVLRRDQVGISDNFFELGGHSLLATQVVSQIRDIFGAEIGVRSLFENPTAKGLSQNIGAAIRAGDKVEAPPLGKTSKEGTLPLSFAQQRLWFIDQLEPGNAGYNISGPVWLKGQLNLEALERVINEIIRRHEVLRTRFVVVEDEPAQVVEKWEQLRLKVEDLTSLIRDEKEKEVRKVTREEAETRFDLNRGPLLRVKVLKLEEDEHLVLFTMHHIVGDGWSLAILFREIGELYRAYSAGEESPLDELPIQYADFAVWQREWLKGEVLETELEYWRKHLARMENLELPTDHPRPPVRSYRGANRSFVIERETAEKLRALGQQEGVTLFMALLAGFYVVMGRYSGQADVTIGTDIANRNRAEIEGLIGFFVNQLVMRAEVRARESLGEFLKRVRDICLGAYAHQDVPFEKLVEQLQPARDLSRSPLFQVKLILQNAQGKGLELEGLKLTSVDSEVETAKLDLTLSITDGGRGLVGGVNYSRDLFENETIERLISHYLNVLKEIVNDRQKPICELSMLSDEERAQIIVEWNQTGRPYAQDLCIHELFEEQVEKTPEAVALICEELQLTYAELNARVNQLARFLGRLGVGPEVLVGVCLERSLEMVVGLLAVLKAGGAYVPLEPTYPAERLTSILVDSIPMVVLTHAHVDVRIRSALAGTGTRVIDLENDAALWADELRINIDRVSVDLMPERLAYVIYTSGSTGRPKGVMNDHRGVINRLLWMQEAYGLNHRDAVVQKTPFSFDVSVWEFFWPLFNGAKLVMASAEGHKDPSYLADIVQQQQITTLHFVPSMLQVFLEHGEMAKCSSLVRVICSGEALPGSLVGRFREQLSQADLYNLYGPTEAAVDVTAWTCTRDIDLGTVPIGRPIANTHIYLLDSQGQPAPVGVKGEIHIGGVQVARGYLNQPGLTAEKFIIDPFAAQLGARMYRTGDLARYLPNGDIEYLGRNDFQVKIRGFRIELGEIEARLANHPAVREAVMMVREDKPGDKRLVAYFTEAPVADNEALTTSEALRSYLSIALPEYMVPAAYVRLESLPLTANGKIDRQALPVPDGSAYDTCEYEAPIGATETALARIWAGVLRLERVGRQDNFFALGGHSLLAVGLIERMRREGLQTDVRTLFTTPTLAEMALATEQIKEIVL